MPPERRDFNWRYQYQLGQRQVKRLARLNGGSYGYKSAVSEDGKLLAAVTGDRVQIWDLDAGKAGALLETGHGGDVSAAFDPDGKTLATGGADGLVKLWDVPEGKLRSTLTWQIADDKDRHREVYSLAFDPGGKKLAVGGHYYDKAMADKDPDGRLRYFVVWVWDLAGGTGKLLTSHEKVPKGNWHDQTSAYCLAYSPDGKTLAMGTSRPSAVWLFDADSGERRTAFRHEAGWVGSVAFSRDGKRLAFGNTNGNAFVVDLEQNKIRHTLVGHRWHIHCCAFTDDGFLVTGSYGESDGGTVRVWDPNAGELRTLFRTGDVRALGLRPRDKQVVALTEQDAQVWSLRVAAPAAVLGLRQDQKRGAPGEVAFDEQGARLAAAGQDNQVRLWKLSREIVPGGPGRAPRFASVSARPDGSLPGHTSRTTAVAFGPGAGGLVAAGAEDGRILVWRVGDAKPGPPRVLAGAGPVVYLAVLPDGKSLLSAAEGKEGVAVSLWNLEDQTAQSFPKPFDRGGALSVSRDGRRLAAVDRSGETRVWDVGKRALVTTLPPPDGGKAPPAGKSILGVHLDPESAGGGRITQFVPGGPAEKAGLKADDVVVQVGAQKVTGATSLQEAIRAHPAGQEVAIKVRRGKQEVDLKAVLGAAPRPPGEAHVRVAWNADGTSLATLLGDTVVVHDLNARTSHAVPLDPHHPAFTGFTAITGDLKTVAAACDDRTVRLFDVVSGHQRGEIPVLSHNVFGVAFNHDATLLATVSLGHARWDGAGEIKLWAAAPP